MRPMMSVGMSNGVGEVFIFEQATTIFFLTSLDWFD
jgi:hypothetical protein